LETHFKLPSLSPPAVDEVVEAPQLIAFPEPTSVAPPLAPVVAEGEAVRIDALLREQLGEKSYKHCFAGVTQFQVAGDEVILGVGSPFLMSWMQKEFRAIIAEVARGVLGPSARVRFEVDGQLALNLTTEQSAEPKPAPADTENSQTPNSASSPKDANYRPGRQFSRLEDFVAGENVSLAMTAVQEICLSPGQHYNPLYLHGGVGLGKTHLLEGIHRAMRQRFASMRVLYLTAEAFTNYFTEALREKTLPSFRQRFRNVNVLLVDDLDFLESKRGIQEEFLHTYKQLESRGGQLVLTANRHPRLMPNLSDELMTRCLSGLVCRLEPPDQSSRLKIAAAHAARLKADLGEDILEFAANRFSRNVRELQGAINTLATFGRMIKRRVSVSAARRVLADLERDCTRIVRMADVEHTVCQFFGITPQDLKSARRIRTLTQPRMLAMFLIRKHTQAAYQEIGQFFGGRNHATVISAEKKVLGWLSAKTPLKIASESWPIEEVLEALERQLQAG
jgi:chromosomal replication initiator protein